MAAEQKHHWAPSMNLPTARTRAEILKRTRDFFAARNILEVETPVLCHSSTTDPMIDSIRAEDARYLQTSPEFCMKRLLAAGFGPIYQLCKAFRREESGRYHNPEFTILEWYRPGFSHHHLMDEMDDFLQLTLQTKPSERITYQALFEIHCKLNPLTASTDDLKAFAQKNDIHLHGNADHDTWLHLIMSHIIEPTLGADKPLFIYDYPKSQAALAKINGDVAERFEVYYQGIELANGFHELTDASEQRARFEKENQQRKEINKETIPLDHALLDALKSGIPDCAGVALGFDRLVMLATKQTQIQHVITFNCENV